MGINDRQASLFLGGNPEWQKRIREAGGGKPAAGAPRPKVRKEDRPENQVEAQIKTFLQSRGWVLTRNHVGTFVGVGRLMADLERGVPITKESVCRSGMVHIGEKGAADWAAERPLHGTGKFAAMQRFLFEVKAPGESPKPHQMDWLRIRAALGFSAAWFDRFDGIPPDKGQPFLPWYVARFKD